MRKFKLPPKNDEKLKNYFEIFLQNSMKKKWNYLPLGFGPRFGVLIPLKYQYFIFK